MQNRIYLDFNATTPLSVLIKSKWDELFDLSGNPSSIHQDSRLPKFWLRESRQKFSKFINCHPLEIVFNSGASEGNNSVLKSIFNLRKQDRNEIIISQVEHPSVMKTAEYLETQMGALVHRVPVDKDGQLDLNFYRSKLSNKTSLVSIMMANNETGHVFPIKDLTKAAHQVGALFHSDSVQALGKLPVDLQDLGIDYATFSAHKFYALKGCGILYIKKNSPWVPLIHGGGQERSRRGGTENILAIASLAISLDQLNNLDNKINEMSELRDYFETIVLQKIKNIVITGKANLRVPNTSSLVISNVDGETLLMSLDLRGFSVSTGAACSSGNPEPSPVLIAMGLTREEAQSSLRVSIGWTTTKQEIISFVNCLVEIVEKLRSLNSTNMSAENSLKPNEIYERLKND